MTTTLGRLESKEVDQANGSVFLTSYTYVGLKTTINASGLTMHRIYNGLEQLVETQDAEGGYTRYSYDSAGNPIAVQDAALSTITAQYTALGHKLWVDDPNMGLKNFSYNAAGEVLSELDANGDSITLDHDVLGRLTERRVNGVLRGSWHYDNPAADKGLGLLDYEDSHPGSDGSGLQKHYAYSTTASGRKDLTKVTHRFYTNSNPSNATDYVMDYYTDSFYARPKGVRYPGGVGVGYLYNNRGFVTHEVDASSTYVIREVTARDSRNQIITGNLTDGTLNYSAEYYDASGQTKSISVSGGSGLVHDLYYEYDFFGNLQFQRTNYSGATSTETFVYDDLHRLTQSSRTLPGSTSVINYDYDATGNLTLKSDYATSYTYSPSRPNAVSSIMKISGGSVSFSYDANGNMTVGDGKTLSYNAFNKPTSITAGGVTADFYYGSDLSRYKQTKSNGETTLYIDKSMEIVTVGTTTDYRHYLSDVAILTKTGDLNDPIPAVSYLHKDRLGSLVTITDATGAEVQARGFDPFGKPRDGDWADRNPPTLDGVLTERGFTGHEHLDESQLIHMNGRVFDYNLGRFLSVDPIIQSPGDSQSVNPYSYIMNNPLSGTDPSGYAPCGEVVKEGEVCQVEVKETYKEFGSRLTKTRTRTFTIANNGVQPIAMPGSDRATFDRLEIAMNGGKPEEGAGAELRPTPVKIGEWKANDRMCSQYGVRCQDEQFLYDPFAPSALEVAVGDVLGVLSGKADDGYTYNTITKDIVDKPLDTKLNAVVGTISVFIPVTRFNSAAGRVTVGAGAWTTTSLLDGGVRALVAPNMVKHHIFNVFRGSSPKSQKYRDFFKMHGIDLDAHTVLLTVNEHKLVHQAGNNWTTQWKRWIDANPNATTKDVYQQAGRMMDAHGLSGKPIVHYRDTTP